MEATIYRSETHYRAPVGTKAEPTRPRRTIQEVLDSVVEYPGSRKGEFGEWRLTGWIDGKLHQVFGRGGTERG